MPARTIVSTEAVITVRALACIAYPGGGALTCDQCTPPSDVTASPAPGAPLGPELNSSAHACLASMTCGMYCQPSICCETNFQLSPASDDLQRSPNPIAHQCDEFWYANVHQLVVPGGEASGRQVTPPSNDV